MSFEKGKINFSVVEFTEGCDREKLLANIVGESYSKSYPTLDSPVVDYTSGVSLASMPGDAEVTEEEFTMGGLPYFAIRVREKKIDTALVREIVERRLHDLEKQGTPITSKLKKQVKEEVAESMEDDAVEKMSGNRCMFLNSNMKTMLTDVTSPKRVYEVVLEHLTSSVEMSVFGSGNIFRMDPEYLYTMITGKSADRYIPVRMNNFNTIEGIGHDFLTYLFMASEVENFFDDGTVLKLHGDIELEDCRDSLTGAKKVSLKEGAPSISNEVVSALSAGKKVKSADMMISFGGGGVYSLNVDKDFSFKRFAMEEEKNLDQNSKLQARANSISIFIEGFKKVFKKFVESEEMNEKFILGWLKERQSNVDTVA